MTYIPKDCFMKNKSLKHYKRKKFFYRFFMRKFPRSGVIFGLMWMRMNILLATVVCWLLRRWASNEFYAVIVIAAIALVGTISALYGFFTFAANFYTILRNELKKSRWWKIPALAGAWYMELAGMFLLPVVLQKRRWTALICLLILLGCTVALILADTPLQRWYWGMGGTFMFLCALLTSGKNERYSWEIAVPLSVFLFLVSSLHISEFYFKVRVKESQSDLSKLLQKDISTSGWKKRNDTGFPVGKEPLKTFLAAKYEKELDSKKHTTPREAQKIVAELHKKHPEFFTALDQLLQIPPQRIAYTWGSPGDPLVDMSLPELQNFRFAVRVLALEIRSNPQNKKQVSRCSNTMEKLREWCSLNETLIDKLEAALIENIRLDALSYITGSGAYSKSEINALIGPTLDWSKQFSETLASEYAMTSETLPFLKNEWGKNIQSSPFEHDMKDEWTHYQKYVPLIISVNLQRDCLFALNHYRKLHALMNQEKLSGIEKKKQAELNPDNLRKELFLLSHTCIPSGFPEIFIRISRIQDFRQMALLAVEVMEYRKQHGKLPDDLTFLPEIPLSKLDHKPLMYEKTKDGFRIFSHTDKGEKPDEKDTQYSYWVRLPKQAALSTRELTAIAEKELLKVYGKQVLKQRPWKIIRSDDKSVTISGTLHGRRKGGVAEITLQKSNGKVLNMIHGK